MNHFENEEYQKMLSRKRVTVQEILGIPDMTLTDAGNMMVLLANEGKLFNRDLEARTITDFTPISPEWVEHHWGWLLDVDSLYIVARRKGESTIPNPSEIEEEKFRYPTLLVVDTLEELTQGLELRMWPGEWYDNYEFWVTRESSHYYTFKQITGSLYEGVVIDPYLLRWVHEIDANRFREWGEELGVPWTMPPSPLTIENDLKAPSAEGPWDKRIEELSTWFEDASRPNTGVEVEALYLEHHIMGALQWEISSNSESDHIQAIKALSRVITTLSEDMAENM